MIPDSFLEELKQRCDIESLISSYVLLKRAGRNLKGLCPFHSEKTPSFVVYPESQSFYCFGCGAGGDAISFIMRAENLEYIEAVKFLAEKAGLGWKGCFEAFTGGDMQADSERVCIILQEQQKERL